MNKSDLSQAIAKKSALTKSIWLLLLTVSIIFISCEKDDIKTKLFNMRQITCRDNSNLIQKQIFEDGKWRDVGGCTAINQIQIGAFYQKVFPSDIAFDSEENTYVVGYSDGYFGKCKEGYDCKKIYNSFILKLNAQNQLDYHYQWGKSYSDIPIVITSDSQNRVLVVGETKGVMGKCISGLCNISEGFSKDIFITVIDGDKFDSYQIGSAGDDSPKAIYLDEKGNLFITGTTDSQLGICLPQFHCSKDYKNGFIAKITPTFNVEISLLGSQFVDTFPSHISVSSSGDIYLAGYMGDIYLEEYKYGTIGSCISKEFRCKKREKAFIVKIGDDSVISRTWDGYPFGIELNKDGDIYVGSIDKGERFSEIDLIKFSSNMGEVEFTSLHSSQDEDHHFSAKMAIDSDDKLYIINREETYGNHLFKFEKDGNSVKKYKMANVINNNGFKIDKNGTFYTLGTVSYIAGIYLKELMPEKYSWVDREPVFAKFTDIELEYNLEEEIDFTKNLLTLNCSDKSCSNKGMCKVSSNNGEYCFCGPGYFEKPSEILHKPLMHFPITPFVSPTTNTLF